MMQKRYAGEFAGADGTAWKVEIFQSAEAAYPTVGELSFPYDKPLLIEWEVKGKEEVVQGSSATLKVLSPSDRAYVDLYQVKPCAVRMDVYRDGALYWKGTLDTELYEEPYERKDGYEVTLTFADFGVLERKKLYGHETQSVRTMIERAIAAAGLEGLAIDDSLISTTLPGDAINRRRDESRLYNKAAQTGDAQTGDAMNRVSTTTEAGLLDELFVSGDNWYDDDGEAMTAAEIVEGLLQPLALRMIQREGKVWIYDINGLTGQERTWIEWSAARQTLGTDKVYNNVKVTWSPYVREGNLVDDDSVRMKTDPSLFAFDADATLNGGTAWNGSRYNSYHYSTDSDDWADPTDCGFTLWTSSTGKNATLRDAAVRFFKVEAQNDGDDSDGVAVMWTGVWGMKENGDKTMIMNVNGVAPDALGTSAPSGVLWESAHATLPGVKGDGLRIRVTLEMLLDPRSNPFEQATDWMPGARERTYQEQWNRYGNFVYVPVCIKCKDTAGKVWCWDNRDTINMKAGLTVKTLEQTLGFWKEYSESAGKPGVWGYLAYYSGSDRENTAGVAGGWAKNRPGINPHKGNLTTQLEKAEGAYLPYPDGCTEVWVEVLKGGWVAVDDSHDTSDTRTAYFFQKYESGNYKIRHIWMKLPALELLRDRLFDEELDADDITYSAELEAEAEEELEIETVCGSAAGGVAGARGVYVTQAGKQVTELSRAGKTAQIEELLIGTMYSQYAARHTTLSGEAELPPAGLGWCAWVDRAQEATRFFMLSQAAEDARAGTMDAEFTEITADEYVKADVTEEENE